MGTVAILAAVRTRDICEAREDAVSLAGCWNGERALVPTPVVRVVEAADSHRRWQRVPRMSESTATVVGRPAFHDNYGQYSPMRVYGRRSGSLRSRAVRHHPHRTEQCVLRVPGLSRPMSVWRAMRRSYSFVPCDPVSSIALAAPHAHPPVRTSSALLRCCEAAGDSAHAAQPDILRKLLRLVLRAVLRPTRQPSTAQLSRKASTAGCSRAQTLNTTRERHRNAGRDVNGLYGGSVQCILPLCDTPPFSK